MSKFTDTLSRHEDARLYAERDKRDKRDARVAQLQAQIDSLMMEYCPEEMTDDQRINWSNAQRSLK